MNMCDTKGSANCWNDEASEDYAPNWDTYANHSQARRMAAE